LQFAQGFTGAAMHSAVEGNPIAAGGNAQVYVGSTWCQCPWWLVLAGEHVDLCSHVRAAICAAVIELDLEIHALMASGGPVHFESALASFCCGFYGVDGRIMAVVFLSRITYRVEKQ
jgi:hypothetical protein